MPRKNSSSPIALALAALLAVGAACTVTLTSDTARAADAPSRTEDGTTMLTNQLAKMKQTAAIPADADAEKTEIARLIVMDHMAMQMAMDPQSKQACQDTLKDANVKKLHDAAVAMAKDPTQMKKLEDEVMADPNAMRMVTHEAMKMSMNGTAADKTMEGMMQDK